MQLDPGNFIDRFILFWNCWEPDESLIIKKLLDRGDTFVDVGANIGYFSLLGQRCVGDTGHVIAIEPVPDTIARFHRNLALNPSVCNIQLEKIAVSDSPGTVRIYQPHAGNIGANTMRSSESTSADSMKYWDLDADSIDNVTSSYDAIRLVKIDLEGAEMLAIEGMEKTLASKSPAVLVEVTDKFLREIKGDAESLFEFFIAKGYSAYVVGDRSVQRAACVPKIEQSNMVFAKKPADIKILESLVVNRAP